jgi:2-polyprenyl-3-methyl-5-hydroxy-6-metoxy-1,4-benzoquinol methylase
MTVQTMNPQKAEAFAGQMVGMLNNALGALLVSVGNRLGIFDTMAGLPPSTSAEIAKATGLNERYIREWLGGMTVARIVEHDGAAGTYWLPPEHAASITHAAGPGNLATMAQFVSLFGNVEDQVIASFQKGGGVPYSQFPQFGALMAQLSAQTFDAALIDTLKLAPGLTERLQEGIDVADIGCGQGHAINLMAREFPNSRFTGYDFGEESVAAARSEAKAWGLQNAAFEVKDVSTIDAKERYDLITAFDAIHDQAKPRQVLKAIYDALRPGGIFLCADIAADSSHAGNMDHPMATAFYACSTFHCMTVSLALDGEGLGTMWGEQKARELFDEAGFTDITAEHVPEDIMNVYYVCRK